MSTSFSEARNYLSSTLAADIGAGASAFSIPSGGSAWPSGQQILRITDGTKNELVLVGSRSGNNFTVLSGGRGYGGTNAEAWSSGDTVELVMTAEHLTELQEAVISLEQFQVNGWGMAPGIYTVPYRNDGFAGTFIDKDQLILVPILVYEEVAIDTLMIDIAGAGTLGGQGRLGLYRPTGGLDFELVVDGGTLPVDSTGLKPVSVDETLPPAMYAGAFVHNSATQVQVRSASIADAGFYHLFPQSALNSTRQLIQTGHTFGTLPLTLSPPYSYRTGLNMPLIGINVT